MLLLLPETTNIHAKLPPSLDIQESVADLSALDQLRPRLHRLRDLLSRGEDTKMARGSDIYNFCLDAYASLKISGKGCLVGNPAPSHVGAF